MNRLTYYIIVNVIILITILILAYKRWLPSIFPNLFYRLRIYEHNFLNYKEKTFFLPFNKNTDSFKIEEYIYFTKDQTPTISPKGIYTWNYEKGNSIPIKYPLKQERIDAKLISQIKNLSMDDIWFSSNGLKDFLENYGIIILGAIMLIIFSYLIISNNYSTALLQNITK